MYSIYQTSLIHYFKYHSFITYTNNNQRQLPTLGELFNKLLAFDDGNEVYEIRLDRSPYDGLIGMNCREVMNCIPDAIVIAVQRGWSDVKKWRQGKAIVRPKYVVPYECHELRKEDRLLIITRELHEVEIHVRALGLDTQYEKIKTQASKDTIIRREKSTWCSSAKRENFNHIP